MKRIKNSDMAQTLNGQPQPIQPMVQSAMFYPNTYMNFTQAGEYTKHYYNGTERIASRIGEQQIPISVENNQELEAYKQDVKQIIYNAIGQHLYDEPTDMQEGDVFPLEFLQATGDNNAVYYYHPNHLSSTMYVTDAQQSVVQSFLYAPYGEIISEYHPGFNGNVLPNYAFNAKELDEETGMYYYEARYYAPPVFISRDPLMSEKPWLTPYHYCSNNPVGRVDPSGCEDGIPPTWVRTAFFGLKHPNIASAIGLCRPGEMNTNISTRSERFATRGVSFSATNTIFKNNGCEEDIDPCSEIGAFRHALWQAAIASKYGCDIATEVGNAHEENPYADLTARSFTSMAEADQVVDLLNNILGRKIGELNPNCPMNKLAGEVLELFYTKGLYTGKLNDDGTWSVSRTIITKEQYDNYKSVLDGLDFNGFNSTEQVNYRAKCERVYQSILDAGKWMDNK